MKRNHIDKRESEREGESGREREKNLDELEHYACADICMCYKEEGRGRHKNSQTSRIRQI